ncbi:SMC family ATPase [Vibrio sp.]|nr:SMC family ATPase [Vibrio sp.]
MKPICLDIHAFGPFATHEKIDFASLGSSPFFLINGPTGAGKSSLLDAICFALFNETTGSERSGDQMRCDFANKEDVTSVSFEFELGEKRYLIQRSPEQMLPKKRGDGYTKQTHKATFYELVDNEEKLISNKPAEIQKEIHSRIGLTVKQFRQVMVIPQGQFRELLLASSKDREQILGQLFETHTYLDIEQVLADKASGIRKHKAELDQQISGQLDVAGVSDEEELLARQTEVDSELASQAEILKTKRSEYEQIKSDVQAATLLKDRFHKLKATESQLIEHKASGSTIDYKRQELSLAKKASWIVQDYHNLTSITQRIDQTKKDQVQVTQNLDAATTQLSQLKSTLFELEAIRGQLPLWRDELYQLKSRREQWIQTNQLVQKLETKAAELVSLEGRNQKFQKKLDELAQELKDTDEQKLLLSKRRDTLPIVKQELQYLSDIKLSLIERDKLQTMITKLTREIEQQRAVQHSLQIESQSLENNALRLELSWVSNQAAELAARLEVGQACPVCGSVDHPALAKFTGDLIGKADVDKARRLWQQKKEEWSKVGNKLASLDTELINAKDSYHAVIAKLEKMPSDLDEGDIDKRISIVEKDVAEIEGIDLKPLEEKTQHIQSRIDNGAREQTQLEQQLETIRHETTLLEGQIEAYKKEENQAGTITEIDDNIRRLESQISQFEQRDVQTQKQREEAETRCSVLKAQLDKLTEQLIQSETEQVQLHEHWVSVLRASEFESTEEFIKAKREHTDIQTLEVDIKGFDDKTLTLTTTLSNLQAELSGKDEPQIEYWTSLLNAKQTELEQVNQVVMTLNADQSRLSKVKEGIVIIRKKNVELEQQYSVYGTLSDVASGKNGSRISLHRFVLGVLLDDILIQASHRLRHMSQGRYNLYRKTDRSKGNASSGLELVVEDSYSGKSRDVATLSGGESFMAALALALGLSDVVQSYSGGIRLDTLFIDEGFGSLDTEALDLALQVLLELQRCGRTIGIISHVNELKEQISCRIDVIPSTVGSRIRIIN